MSGRCTCLAAVTDIPCNCMNPSTHQSASIDDGQGQGDGGLFNYTDEQHYNIRLKLHPDCCQASPCAFCGASEEGGTCHGDLSGLALELFEEASCSARNANIKSIGQIVNWKVHDRQARAFDAAARAIAEVSL